MAAALEISLQLELTDPISGVVRRPQAPEQHFDGWLELNATLERLHRSAQAEKLEIEKKARRS